MGDFPNLATLIGTAQIVDGVNTTKVITRGSEILQQLLEVILLLSLGRPRDVLLRREGGRFAGRGAALRQQGVQNFPAHLFFRVARPRPGGALQPLVGGLPVEPLQSGALKTRPGDL
jgi:hypothetical protein